jgi:signal transduction histidine kinase
MPIFIGILAYLVVKYNSFNIKLIATQVLVWALVIFIGAEFFFIQTNTNRVLTAITLVISAWLGLTIVRGVKKEIAQKEELAKLNVDLQNLIKQRESLMHLITHKVKGSFTHSKYIFAGILDGTFGAITPDLQKMAEKGLDSDNVGINTIDLILNTGNMQKGLIKYEMKKADFREIILSSLSEKKVAAETKGLQIEKEIPEKNYEVLGDTFWLKEAVSNLLENSIKYTREGKIIASLEKKENPAKDGASKIILSVKDTGVGITEEDKKNLFTEGGRGKDSVKVNVDSTGYGLFTVKLIAEAHKGRVWAESEGAGKGSQFYIELPEAA